MFSKSYSYCYSHINTNYSSRKQNNKGKKQPENYKYMLLCEVVLGNIYQVGLNNNWIGEDKIITSK
jgi:hypothetical protein